MKNNDLKILFLITSNYPFGIYETFLENEMIYLENAFDKVIILSRDNKSLKSSNRIESESIDVFRIPKKSKAASFFYILKALFSPITLIEIFNLKKYQNNKFILAKTVIKSLANAFFYKKNIDFIIDKYSVNNKIYFYSYWLDDSAISIAMCSKYRSNSFAISRAHKWDIYFHENKYGYLPLRSYLIKNLNKIFSISEHGKSYLDNKFPNFQNKISVSKLGVKGQDINLNEYKSKNCLNILSCSYIRPDKRIELIIKSLQKIKDIEINWTHIGKGFKSLQYQNYIQNLAANIFSKNINYNFLGDMKNFEVLNFLKCSKHDLFINLSSAEGIPVSIMEAMSFAIPVIATNVGGTSEIVNNENGYLLSANPVLRDVTVKIQEFYNLSLEEKTKKRKAAFDTWNNKYNSEKNYESFVNDIISIKDI